MARGGARPGAGKPKGTTNRPVLRNALTPQKITALLNKAVSLADSGDSVMLKFLLEQIYGKAVQPIGGDDEKPLVLQINGMKIVKE